MLRCIVEDNVSWMQRRASPPACVAAAEAEARGWKTSQEKTAWYIDQLKKNGMTVDAGSPQLKAELRKLGQALQRGTRRRAQTRN